jgi:hypothetical protein
VSYYITRVIVIHEIVDNDKYDGTQEMEKVRTSRMENLLIDEIKKRTPSFKTESLTTAIKESTK